MPNDNKFPESRQKEYLRDLHFATLVERKIATGRELAYLGLPSADMLDIKLWRSVLHHITAVEQDPSLVLPMHRTAIRLGVDKKIIVIEKDLNDVAALLSMDEKSAKLSLAQLSLSEQVKIRRARSIGYDVINLDPYGGFLYPTDAVDKNTELLKNFIQFQSRHNHSFMLIITFELRDTGRDHYLEFINTTLELLSSQGVDVAKTKEWYTAEKGKHPSPTLRRMKFCVPIFLLKIAYDSFQVKSCGAWQYKNYYHTALFFEARSTKNVLGVSPYPPVDQCKEIINRPVIHVEVRDSSQIELSEIESPPLL